MATPTRTILAVVLIATTGVLPTFLVGALAVQLHGDLGIGSAELGMVISLSFLCAAVSSLGLGRFTERCGAVPAMRIAGTLSAMSLVAVAAFARSPISLLACLIVAGIGNAFSQPATNLYVSQVFPPHRQGLAFAVKTSAIPAATLLGGVAVPTIALTVGWRWAFLVGAILALGAALAVPTISFSARRHVQVSTENQPSRTLAILSLTVGLGSLATASLGTFATSAFQDAGISAGTAGFCTAGGSALLVVVRLALGQLADRVRTIPLLPAVAALLILGAAGWLLMSTMQSVLLIIGAAVAYSLGWGWPGLFNLAIIRSNGNAATATSATQMGTYLGIAIGPMTFGALTEGPGYGIAWTLAASTAVLSAAFAIIGHRQMMGSKVTTASTLRPELHSGTVFVPTAAL
jgi:MFS family permease